MCGSPMLLQYLVASSSFTSTCEALSQKHRDLFIDDQLVFFLAMQSRVEQKYLTSTTNEKRFLVKENEIVRVINIKSEQLEQQIK